MWDNMGVSETLQGYVEHNFLYLGLCGTFTVMGGSGVFTKKNTYIEVTYFDGLGYKTIRSA